MFTHQLSTTTSLKEIEVGLMEIDHHVMSYFDIEPDKDPFTSDTTVDRGHEWSQFISKLGACL